MLIKLQYLDGVQLELTQCRLLGTSGKNTVAHAGKKYYPIEGGYWLIPHTSKEAICALIRDLIMDDLVR